MRRFVASVVVALAGLALVAAPAQSRKVRNPSSSLGAILAGGNFNIHDGKYSGTISAGFPLLANGKVGSDGTIVVPKENIGQLVFPVPDSSGSSGPFSYSITNEKATFIPTDDAVGSLDPFTGAASLRLRFYIKGEYTATVSGFGGNSQSYSPTNCQVGSPAAPIDVTLTTGLPAGGVPYDDSTGKLTVADNTFALPASQGCDPQYNGFPFTGYFDTAVGLPSPSGHNKLVVSGQLNPVIQRGVIASLITGPVNPAAPATITLDASHSIAPAGIRSFEYDFNGDGVYDVSGTSSAVSFVYSLPGSYSPRVRVTDADGDTSVAIAHVTVLRPLVFLTGLHVGPARFAATKLAPPITTVRYTLNRAASVRFSVIRLLPGRVVKGSCKATTKKRRTGRKCSRAAPAGAFARAAVAGANQFLWDSRIRGRTLKPGTYRLVAVASSGGESSPPVTAPFRVAKPR